MKGNRKLRNSFYEEFEVDTSSLGKEDILVLEKLKETSKLVASLYKLQFGDNGQPLFYPTDATRTEIEKAAVDNPAILSPFTVVERDRQGKLVTTPYHIKFKDQIAAIAEKLNESAILSTNREFANALRVQAKSLITGEYDKAQINWLRIKPYKLDIVIGPLERIEDELFFVKRSYQAWVGIMDHSLTERANSFMDTVFAAKKGIIAPDEQINFMDKAQIRVDDTIVFAGMIAKFNYTGTTLPNDIRILEKYGSEATIFMPMVKNSFEKRHLPIFEAIFASQFRQSFSANDLFRGYLYTVMMHEIARVLIRYRFATTRLKEMYPVFNELAVEASAIKQAGSLLLKDMISQKEMESILVMFLTRIFDYYFEMKDNPGMEAYVLGNAILLNSLVSSGALKITSQGISWPNFTKMYIAVSNLADDIEKILAEGSYRSAQSYLDKHSSLTFFSQFHIL